MKRLFTLALAFVIVIGLIPFSPYMIKANAAYHNVTTLAELQSALSTANGGDIIYLKSTVQVYP